MYLFIQAADIHQSRFGNSHCQPEKIIRQVESCINSGRVIHKTSGLKTKPVQSSSTILHITRLAMMKKQNDILQTWYGYTVSDEQVLQEQHFTMKDRFSW